MVDEIIDRSGVGTFESADMTVKAPTGPKPALVKRRQRYKAAAMRACTAEQMTKIFKKAVEQAIDGEPDARKFVVEHLIGKPQAATEDKGGMQIGSLQIALFGKDGAPPTS